MAIEVPAIEIYESAPAALHPYDPRAVDVARRVAELIQSRLPDVEVEHVGSTSVPGCEGKGIVDLMVVYPEWQLTHTRDGLDALGFQRQTDSDPFPEDRPMRVAAIHQGMPVRLHVHVLGPSSSEPEELRRFRDRLRADPALVRDYVAAKRAILDSGCTDSVDYCIRKGEFVQHALRGDTP